MKRYIGLSLTLLLLFMAPDIWARNTLHEFSITDVIEKPENANRLSGIALFFGEQKHPYVEKSFGEFSTNKKTNAFNKTDIEACEWVMMSALLQLHQRALSMGADAVINIKSNYKNVEKSSETHFTCGAGATMAGVALKGTPVKLK